MANWRIQARKSLFFWHEKIKVVLLQAKEVHELAPLVIRIRNHVLAIADIHVLGAKQTF